MLMRLGFFFLFGSLAVVLPCHAADGLNTSAGALPIGAGNNVVMWVTPDQKVVLADTVPGSVSVKLEVGGSVRIGTDARFTGEGGACDVAGLLIFDGQLPGHLFVCSGSSWQKIPPG